MQYLQADVLFPVSVPPIRNGMLQVDAEGVIMAVIDPSRQGSLPDPSSVQHFRGFLCPGFINGHGHLELSYLKGKIPERTGLAGFLGNMLAYRNSFSPEQIRQAITEAEAEMIRNGIVAAGDISNGPDTFACKAENHMFYHTFLELYDLDEARTEANWQHGLKLMEELQATMPASHTCSLVPHAPYSVTQKLMALLNDLARENNSLLTIHNQECEGENELFISRSGPLLNFFTIAGYSLDFAVPTGKTSIRSSLPGLSGCGKLLLVHNTFTSREDVEWAAGESPETWWCFCPKANLYIENRLPDITNFRPVFNRILLGTDSLASNHGLSILEEMKTLLFRNPWLSLQEVMPWATRNGARFFGLEQTFGSLEKGKRPGINLLEGVDTERLQLKPETSIRKLF